MARQTLNPTDGSTVDKMLRARADFFARIRLFFQDRNVCEVDTPLLNACGVTDVNLMSLAVPGQGYLITSPEYRMKALLAAGSGDIYQLSHVFRGDECGQRHLSEFMLLEWYRREWDYHTLIKETAELIRHLLPNFPLPIKISTYAELFQKYLKIDVFTTTIDALRDQCQRIVPESKSWQLSLDVGLDLLFTHCIEPQLGRNCLEFVHEYLPSQAALAKIIYDARGNRVAARFEAYISGIELCNGFQELLDATEQRARFIADNQIRQQRNLPLMTIDEDFLTALAVGIPTCSGVAVGVDRLWMLYCAEKNIRHSLPWEVASLQLRNAQAASPNYSNNDSCGDNISALKLE